jgi:hypothetical protein
MVVFGGWLSRDPNRDHHDSDRQKVAFAATRKSDGLLHGGVRITLERWGLFVDLFSIYKMRKSVSDAELRNRRRKRRRFRSDALPGPPRRML